MRPIRRPLSADAHADARRTAQISGLALSALEPIVDEYEAELILRLTTSVNAAIPMTHERVWATIGELTACAELRQRLEARRRLPPETTE